MFFEKVTGMSPPRRSSRKWKDNIKIEVKEMCDDVATFVWEVTGLLAEIRWNPRQGY
jgi:hypothetical protein